MAFTITVTGKRNLGGGAMIAYGSLAADTGAYSTGGLVTTPTFASLDDIGAGGGDEADSYGRRAPSVVLFSDGDGYKWSWNDSTQLVLLYALQLSGAAQANLAYGQHTAAAVAAGVGANVTWVAFWFAITKDDSVDNYA